LAVRPNHEKSGRLPDWSFWKDCTVPNGSIRVPKYRRQMIEIG